MRVWILDGLALPATLMAWGFALYVFRVAPRTPVTRQLIALLIFDGINVFSSELLPAPIQHWIFADSASTFRLHLAADFGMLAVYLPFLGASLESKLVGVLRIPAVRWACWITGGTMALVTLVDPERVRPGIPFLWITISLAFLWGLIAAVDSWRRATNEVARVRARSFVIAFGVRDVLWSGTFAAAAASLFGFIAETGPLMDFVYRIYLIAVIVYVPLVAYGILRAHLFDIDLRLKWTIRQSTVAAVFMAVFFLISEGATTFLSQRLGTTLGLLGAAALVFVLAPLQRLGERMADAAVPSARATPEYESFRKLQVYEAALLTAYENGDVTDRERRVLESLRASLAIDAAVAERLERDAASKTADLRPSRLP